MDFLEQNILENIDNTHYENFYDKFNISKNLQFNNNYKEKSIPSSSLTGPVSKNISTEKLIILSSKESAENRGKKRLFFNAADHPDLKNENICNVQSMKKFCYYK